MTTLRIKRTNEIQNFFAKYQILVDGEIKGTISHGMTKEIEISPGKHKLIAKIQWCKSQELTIDCDENETKIFTLSGIKNKWLIQVYVGLISLIILLITTMLIQKNDLNMLMYVFIVVSILIFVIFLVLIYYLTIGRNKYLQIKETNIK